MLGCEFIWTQQIFTGVLNKNISWHAIWSITTMHYIYIYIYIKRLWNALFIKNYIVLAWFSGKPNWVQQFEMEDVSLRKLITYQIWLQKLKLPHSPNPVGMVFKTMRIFIGWFAINLSSSLMKILPIHNTVEANAGDPFWEMECPHMSHILLIHSKNAHARKNQAFYWCF